MRVLVILFFWCKKSDGGKWNKIAVRNAWETPRAIFSWHDTMRDPFWSCFWPQVTSNMFVYDSPPHPLASVSRKYHWNHARYGERLRNSSETPRGEAVNEHVRGCVISNPYGETIPHGAVPRKNIPRHYWGVSRIARRSHIPARRKRLEATSTRKASKKIFLPTIKFVRRFSACEF